MEALVVLGISATALLVALPHSLRWLSALESSGAVYQTQMLLQLARMEAVSRNRACRYEISTLTRRVTVYDLNDPADASDDVAIASERVPSRIGFGDPQGHPAITLESLGGGRYGATFASDGSVSAGIGRIEFEAKGDFRRVSLLGAGGTRAERWNGTLWSQTP
jgi:hypothetical protein